MDEDASVKVFCRVRPPNERERGVEATALGGSAGFLARSSSAAVGASFAKKCVTVPASDAAQQTLFLHSKHGPARTFTFDRVFGEHATQTDVFQVVGAPVTQACLEGYNGTIFAYGQTGSGKTFTMQGPDDVIDAEALSLTPDQLALRGLVPRVFDYLFDSVEAQSSGKSVQHTFACSFLEIYNERVYDLLDGGSANDAAGLQLRENGRKGVHVEGLIESVVTNSKKAAELMTIGAQNRRVGQTSMNRESSRSHSVFILQLQSKETSAEGTKIRTSRFNLVDLAGSERQRSTDAAGERLKEAGSINKSLSALGNVIMGLSEQSVGKHRHVHYRDSKLTFLLKDSLGGNSKTFMVAAISPAEDSAFETLSTLKFAQRAKMIQNRAVVNEDSVGSALFLQEEIQRLRRQLQQAHQEIARNIPGLNLLIQGMAPSEPASSQDSTTPTTQQVGPCDPAIDSRFRELEESFATTAEKSDRLQRSCEYLQLQNGNFQALCEELKQHIAHLKMMLRLRGVGGPGVYEYEPSADAIEWRMKYEEMEEHFVELQDELQRSGIEDAGFSGKINSEVENLNMMLLALTKQLAFVLRDKHDLQDRLLENQSDKDESMGDPSAQEAVGADFSARLEEALKQQASEYQAKLDVVASTSACLEKNAAEAALEVLQIREREASWSVQQHDLEKQLADSKEALQRSEEAHSTTHDLLVQEKARMEKLEVQLERSREAVRLEFECALADTATTNRDLEHSSKHLQHELTVVTADLQQRDHQLQEVENAFSQLKLDMVHIEEASQRSTSELSEARDKLKESTLQVAHLRTEISDRDNAIDQLERAEAAASEEKLILEQKLEDSSKSILKLQEDADTTAQKHSEVISTLKQLAQEKEQKLTKDFENQLRVQDEKYQQLRAELDDYRSKAEEADRLHLAQLEEKEASLAELQRQLDGQKHESKQALENLQTKLSQNLVDLSKLSEEKERVESERSSAVEQNDRLKEDAKKLGTEKEELMSEIQRLSERTDQLSAKATKLGDENTDLQKKCEEHLAQLSKSEDSITKLTQQVGDLQQQSTAYSSEVAELRKELASAQEDKRQATITHAQNLEELSSSTKKIEELTNELATHQGIADEMSSKLEKTVNAIREAEETVAHQREEIEMYKGIQSTLRDEVRKLEFDRLELTESLKTEQESKHDVVIKFADAQQEWQDEKLKLIHSSQESISAFEKRVEELALSKESLSARKCELEQENGSLKAAVANLDRNLQELKDCVADKDDEIRALESTRGESTATQDELTCTVVELRNSLSDIESSLAENQNALSKQEEELIQKSMAITERDAIINVMKERMQNDEATWDLKTREYKADLEAAHGRAQALEQLVAEKAAVFSRAEEAFLTEKRSLEQKLEEGEEILAQQTEHLMLEIKQFSLSIEEKDSRLQLMTKSLEEMEKRLARSAEDDNSARVKELQTAMEDLVSKHKSVVAENVDLKKKAVADLKEREEELARQRSAINAAEEQLKSDREAVEELKAAAETAKKEAKAKAVSQDVLGQAKRKFLTEKVKLQREIQSLTKKLETVSKENEKLVGHHNSRQKIQHHVKVKEENNRLLDQVRQLTDEKFKLQRSLEKLRTMLKEKENIGVGSITNTPLSVSPASNSSSQSQPTKTVKRPSLGSASTATAGTAASAARAAARLAARGRPISRSASPGPTKKRTSMSSLLDVAKAMNAEAAGTSANLSLVDVAKAENAANNASTKPLTLMDVAKTEAQPTELPKQTLQQLAQEIDKEDRSRIQAALESAAKDVKVERQEFRTQTLKQAAAELHQEEQQAAQVLKAKVVHASEGSTKHEAADRDNDNDKENDEDDGYSSFEDDEDSAPKKDTKKQKEPAEDDPAEEEESYDPPPRTTPSESKESKEFLRAVYRADKYQVRDMLDDGVVDANIADQHGWSGLHWAASQNHSDILQLLLQKGAEINAIDQINGWTALHVAVVRESVPCVQLLLSSGAEPRIRDHYGDSVVECLQAARRKSKLQMLQLLQDARNHSGR
ncbi:Kinesin-like protein [Phytophthora cinnamomi]|uniref:Kinesin-like protein n=1 Tax=Phytophthora cinnamomi TaxID=4785 RepID=UPI00355AA7B4|nr:Kinesin-like protein [Phytophthora cinnamomi]